MHQKAAPQTSSATLVEADRVRAGEAEVLPEAEGYAAWRNDFVNARVCVALWLGFIAILCFIVLDAIVYADHFLALLWIRGFIELGLLGVFALRRSQMAHHHPLFLVPSLVWVLNFGIVQMTVISEGFSSPYYAGLNLVFLGMAVIVPVCWRVHVVAQLGVLAYYFGVNALITRLGTSWEAAVTSAFFLFWTCLICDVSVFLSERLHRAEFDSRNDLAAAYAGLRELDRLKSEFYANISHELRTPLTLILSGFRMLLHDAETVERRTIVETGLRNTARLLVLINDLLDLAKLDSGRVTPVKRCVDLAALVRQVAANFEPDDRQRRIQLHGVEQATAAIDPHQIKKVLYNLLSNAFKFSDPDQGRVWITLWTDADHVELRVEDNGIGIPPDQLTRIFDRFTQVEGSSTRRYEGTGIGLALVQEIIAQHGGTVTVASQVDRGTTFTITLPRGDVNTSVPADFQDDSSEMVDFLQRVIRTTSQEGAGPLGVPCPPVDTQAPLVLIVEDNGDLRSYLQHLLGRHYRTATATDGAEGLEQAQALRPDLILTDLMMPRMSGRDLLQAVRENPTLHAIPVIVLTARAGMEARIASFDTGADDYLAKPFDDEELLARVRNLLRVHTQERELTELNRHLETRVTQQVGEIERMRHLQRFFSPQLIEVLLSSGGEKLLESHRSEVTVVFCDLRGFTAFSETAEPEALTGVLREYHATLGRLIFHFAGTIERFAGDGLMVFFNDPLPCPDHATRAVQMAVAMRQQMGELTERWRKRGYQLDFGVGIAQGYATLGMIGFEGRMDYGAIGPVTNLASRLCDEAQGAQILISQRVFAEVEPLVEAKPIGELALKGFLKPVPAWNVTGLKEGGVKRVQDAHREDA